MITFALAGNPNCGKTTLFNQLTGSNQYVGNWAGVTVEKKSGDFTFENEKYKVVDLPGIYSLSPYTMEEVIARDFVIKENPDVIINIVDGTNIERNLYLTIQLMELGKPVVVAVNMMDDVKSRGDSIDFPKLSQLLGITVLPIVARHNEGTDKLIKEAVTSALGGFLPKIPKYDENTQIALDKIKNLLKNKHNSQPIDFYVGKLIEGDKSYNEFLELNSKEIERINEIVSEYEKTNQYGNSETMFANARYELITGIIAKSMHKNSVAGKLTVSDRIDMVLTNKFLAIPCFMLLMFAMFSLTFSGLSSTLSSGIEILINDYISPTLMGILCTANAPDWTIGLIIDGVIGGVGGILVFLPQIMILFLLLSILEDSGYMARAAFIMDRLLRKLGLTGKSFIPMLMGFGCTTPAVMAARTMENEKDRRLTIMLTPFMSCGAKLPIYALFASAFFKEYKGLVVFGMYFLGMFVAIIAGLILKNTLFKGDSAPFIMELPTYRFPTLKSLFLHMWEKCKGFLVKAGTIILSMSVIIWVLQNFDSSFHMVANTSDSLFAQLGSFIAPIFIPLGFGTWQATVALLSGLVAKETVVTTLMVLYGATTDAGLTTALSTVFTPASALAFMTFTLLYMPCISAFVSIKREMNSMKWALGTAAFLTVVAYVVSFIVYNLALIIL
ncbi:MAG: ferrous iron transport protein B [Oscillospiraceae bacterium]